MSGLDGLGIGSVYQLILWQMPCFVFLFSGGSRGGVHTPAHLSVLSPYGPKFSQFHAVFSEILAKSYVGASSSKGWRPLLRGILYPPLLYIYLQCSLLFRSWDVNKYGIRCQLAKGIIFYLTFFTAVQLDSLAVRASVSQSMSITCPVGGAPGMPLLDPLL